MKNSYLRICQKKNLLIAILKQNKSLLMFALSPLASFASALVCAIALESGGVAGEGSGSGSYTSYWEFEERYNSPSWEDYDNDDDMGGTLAMVIGLVSI